MKKSKPTILIVNDDGVTAPGIKALMETMAEIGKVIVVAPDSPQSGMGHAITIGKPLRLDKIELYEGFETWSCSGTPVDCVKLAKYHVLKGIKPDLLVSGINHGLNNSINILYSGTMSAAVEGAIEDIPSIGFSLDDFTLQADFSHCLKYVKELALSVLEKGLPPATLLNVNFPNTQDIKGVKVCRQAIAKWAEEFDERMDPHRRPYYWMTGKFQMNDHGEDTDVWALEHHYVSVVPVQFDMTAHHAIPALTNWTF
ncbi:5'/3'-nucleotidase SurE [Mucilaginibacter sp. RS28]|uniref:5'-nucleotidase SurE n=1 Tax=Mucilaginibacter straminoryzae TaxID=2932774 RepID=A0A9X2BA26_9SPHI|nr:5'/3'-nucleotidase SurE [Mucilaginibacter straminoryzae]MCJ8210360.1 5'/3'-nucleotidase SurE [Mucilaginibacter straminoryzae]